MLEIHSVALNDPFPISPFSDQVNPAEIVTIVGPNGAGKSTLLSLLSGYQEPSSGYVSLDGHIIHALPPEHLAHRRALVAQSEVPSFDWRVDEFLTLGISTKQAIEPVISTLELEDLRHRGIQRLSGGERQRVMIGRELCQLSVFNGHDHSPGNLSHPQLKTRVLLLDEPSSALDIGHQQRLMRLLHQLAHDYGIAIICVLHDLNLAMTYSDRVWLMHQGTRIATSSQKEPIDEELLARVFAADLAIEDNGYIRLKR